MSLSAGTRLGSFEITGELGVGGMGEVHRAIDTKLGREVAIKTLPAAFAEDQDRLARFDREAKALAALNHPNIASIYGFEQEGQTHYLVLELVEGPTLADRLAGGAVPIEEALSIAVQIADALEAAHDRGLIHRDLKPANIKIGTDGRVKVLDFGIAKSMSAGPTADPGLPTVTQVTEVGKVIGTPAYMSPEQIRGEELDSRSDIWSFGVVLVEMLTGKQMFEGPTSADITARVLERTPASPVLPAGTPPLVVRLIGRCLAKDRDQRLRHIGDARFDLLDAKEGTFALAVDGAAHGEPRAGARIAVTAMATAVLVGLVAWSLWPELQPAPVDRFEYLVPEDVMLRNGGRPLLAISPDGRHFVFGAEQGLYLRRMGELQARLVPGTEGSFSNPFFSPDGQSVAYFVDGQFRRIAISGGAPALVASGFENPWGARWEKDGMILAGQPEGIVRFSAAGGERELIVPAQSNDERLYGPQLLPDGDSVLFTAVRTLDWNTAEIIVQSISTGERTVVHSGGYDARYVPPGHLTYAYMDDLYAVAFDLDEFSISREPVAIVEGLGGTADGFSGAANYDVSVGGTLVYASGFPEARRSVRLVWTDRSGAELAVPIESCGCVDIALSADGAQVAITNLQPALREGNVQVLSFESQTLTQLTFERGQQGIVSWDGDRVVSRSAEVLWRRSADGAGAFEPLFEAVRNPYPYGIGPDGEILIVLLSEFGDLDIRVLRLSGEATLEPLLVTEFNEQRPALSPDGRWLAYESDETGELEIYVKPYPHVDDGIWRVSEGGGTIARWSADGRHLYFLSPTHLMQAEVALEPSFRRLTPEPLFEYSLGAVPAVWRTYDVAPDGERFLMIKPRTGAGDKQPRIVIVRNWAEELERLVPN